MATLADEEARNELKQAGGVPYDEEELLGRSNNNSNKSTVLKLDHPRPHSKEINRQMFCYGVANGLMVASSFALILITILVVSYLEPQSPAPSPTPPIHFQIHSLSSTSNASWSVVLSVQNRPPLPYALHVYVAKAALSFHRRRLATAFVDPFRVGVMNTTTTASTQEITVMLTADPAADAAVAASLGAGGRGVGFEFRVDGLVRKMSGEEKRMSCMKVVCGYLELQFSSDFSTSQLLAAPKNCVQYWGAIS